MRLIVVGAGSNRLTILEPFYGRFRFAFGLTIERDRFVLGHYNVAGMFRYSWRPILSCTNEQREIKIRFIITVETYCVLMIYFEKKKNERSVKKKTMSPTKTSTSQISC